MFSLETTLFLADHLNTIFPFPSVLTFYYLLWKYSPLFYIYLYQMIKEQIQRVANTNKETTFERLRKKDLK